MNMATAFGHIVIERPGRRSVPIQPINERIYFEALRAFGVRESVALAAMRGLITIKKEVSQ